MRIISDFLFWKEKRNLTKKELSIQFFLSLLTFLILFNVYRYQILTSAHWDVGWIKHVIWRNPRQEVPTDCCSIDGVNSTFQSWSWHLSPLFSLFSVISFAWPFGQHTWLLFFLALPYAAIVFCVVHFGFVGFPASKSNPKVLVIALCSALVGLSFGTFRSISFPHYEIYYTSSILLMIYFIYRNQRWLAILSLVVCVSVKEDSCLYLIIMYLAFCWTRATNMRVILHSVMIAIPTICYLIVLQFIEFDDPVVPSAPGETNLQVHYLGNPPLAHIDSSFLSQRIRLNVIDNIELYLLMISVLGTTIYFRRSLGARLSLTMIPHILVAIIAINDVKGGWAVYHQLPIWTTLLLVIIYLHLNTSFSLMKISFLLVLVLSFLSTISSPARYIFESFRPEIDIAMVAKNMDRVIAYGKSNGFILDENFFVYEPNAVSGDAWLREMNDFMVGDCLVHLENSKTPMRISDLYPKSKIVSSRLDSPFVLTCFYSP